MRSGANNVTTQFPAEGGGGGGTDDRALESKVHEFAADFRRQRDEAHRGKELSAERLRLTKEEVGAANKSLQALKNKLSELKKASGTAATQEIQQLQNEVDSLTNQVRSVVVVVVVVFDSSSYISRADDVNTPNLSLSTSRRLIIIIIIIEITYYY